ncbi:ethanolamine utilization protein EutJ [Acetobacterium malicum]|uniref:Ethanolamine utilization protein EutJ n=1 Tax=Acetobacterium malicum TaxID=52692 RepID=A0ABR6YVJ8_9FIRM|nr:MULTISPECIES: ethanolamine utilization protein EutJ [Acetobacterium]MBC3899189.1 ethanolamine utilization protein EutJ [Acetobacterium malicum]MCG2728841.1 ethanolamine utilization protein EutJ [Acetobacterium sp.]
MDWKSGNDAILEFAELIRGKKANAYTGELKVGVDLGTANIVIAVVDENNRPIAGATQGASVVRDGIVVDYLGASQIVRKLKGEVEGILGVDLTYAKAATAIPPGILAGNTKIISNVVDSADFVVTNVVDEPTAAATVLGIQNGAVVDVGGGTTGISILKDGEVIFTADEATGGTHMSLVLAGFHHISFEEAEELKKNESQKKIFPIIKPVVQKMASIVNRFVVGYDVDVIYVVGGACVFDDFEKIFEDETGIKTIKPVEPLLVTPLGIAFNCQR